MIDPAVTAVHEAGHAVMAYLLGVRVLRVVLHPEGGGTTVLDPLSPDDPHAVKCALLLAQIGAAAEAACAVQRPERYWELA